MPKGSPELPIRTERLTLRTWTDADHPALLDMTSRPDVVRYVPFPPRTAESAATALEQRIGWGVPAFDADGQVLPLAVEHTESGQLVGDFMLMFRTVEHRDAEIGFIFHPDHQGQGYATEAGRAVLSLAFDHYGLHRIFARLDARNQPSARLLARLGMRQEAHRQQPIHDARETASPFVQLTRAKRTPPGRAPSRFGARVFRCAPELTDHGAGRCFPSVRRPGRRVGVPASRRG